MEHNERKKGMSFTWPTNAGTPSLVAEGHTFAMNSMRAMPLLSTNFSSNRANIRPFLNGQELPPPFDDPLLAFERVVFVDHDSRVVPEELQVSRGEVWVRARFRTQRC